MSWPNHKSIDMNDTKNVLSGLKNRLVRKPNGTAVLELGAYAIALLVTGAEKFVANVDNIDNAPFDVKTRERDLFLANALADADYDTKAAAALVATRMQGCDKTVIAKTIDTMCYGVLKSAMFQAYIDYKSALARREGAVPDSFFAQFNRAPAAENCEVDATDVKDFPADPREEEQTAPPGLAPAHDQQFTLNGVRIDVATLDELAPHIAQALDDARIHLENVRLGYGYTGRDRLAFFVEQIGGEWVRHTGTAYDALLAFEKKLDEGNRRKAAKAEAVFREHNAAAIAAA